MTTWHKSSYSYGNGGDCVEVAESSDEVLIRDTKNRALGYLSLPAHEWRAFVAALRHDEL